MVFCRQYFTLIKYCLKTLFEINLLFYSALSFFYMLHTLYEQITMYLYRVYMPHWMYIHQYANDLIFRLHVFCNYCSFYSFITSKEKMFDWIVSIVQRYWFQQKPVSNFNQYTVRFFKTSFVRICISFWIFHKLVHKCH